MKDILEVVSLILFIIFLMASCEKDGFCYQIDGKGHCIKVGK